MMEAMPELADAFLTQTVFARVRTLAWEDLLKMPQPSEKLPATTAVWRYGRALAMLAKGDRAGAAKERAAFQQIAARIPPDAPWGQNKAVDVMKLAREVLAARFGEEPLTHWQKAVEIQDAFTYDEPPAWYYPVRESLGAELLRAGRAPEAEKVLREGLRRSPRNGFMLFGLIEALKSQGKEVDQVKRELDAIWAKSDIKLTLAAL